MISITCRHSSLEMSRMGLCGRIATLLTRMSTLPRTAMPSSTMPAAVSGSETSPIARCVLTPNSRHWAATSSSSLPALAGIQDQVGAFPGKGQGHLAANVPAGPGNQSGFTLQTHISSCFACRYREGNIDGRTGQIGWLFARVFFTGRRRGAEGLRVLVQVSQGLDLLSDMVDFVQNALRAAA